MNKFDFADAFKALNEDVFDADKEGIAELSTFMANDDVEETIPVVDPEAENIEDIKDSYVGKVILDCNVCHSLVYKDKEDIKISDDEENANIDEECPFCYSTDGFKVVGEVCDYCKDCDEKEPEETVEVEDEVEEKEEVESLTEAKVDLTTKENTIANVLKNNMGALAVINNPQELKNKTIEILDNSNIADKKAVERFKRILAGKKNTNALLSTIATFMTGMRSNPDAVDEACDKCDECSDMKECDEIKECDELKEADKPAATSIEDAQKWVDYDMKHLGHISEETNDLVKRAGFQIVKDTYGEYEVTAGKYDESLKESRKSTKGEKLLEDAFSQSEMEEFYDETVEEIVNGVQSGTIDRSELKTYIEDELADDGTFMATLFSKVSTDIIDELLLKNNISLVDKMYKDIIFQLDNYDESLKEDFSTFLNHPKDLEVIKFDKDGKHYKVQYDAEEDSYGIQITQQDGSSEERNISKDSLKKLLSEDFKEVKIKTDETEMEMTSDENGKVTVTTEPVKNEEVEEDNVEMIKPLSDEDKAEIEVASEEDEVEDEFDVDEFDEESFDDLAEQYLTNVYDNIKGYKTSNIKLENNQLICEGIISFESGANKKTTFTFNKGDMLKENKLTCYGSNKELCRGNKSFILTGVLTEGKFTANRLTYNYRVKSLDENYSNRVYGSVKIKK